MLNAAQFLRLSSGAKRQSKTNREGREKVENKRKENAAGKWPGLKKHFSQIFIQYTYM